MVAECPECGKKSLFKYEKRRGDRVIIMVKCANEDCGYENELDSYYDDEDDEEDEDDSSGLPDLPDLP